MNFLMRTDHVWLWEEKVNMKWAALVFASPIEHPVRITDDRLRRATERQVVRRCEIITESIDIIQKTKYEDTRQRRVDLCRKHIDYLVQLKPYAEKKQLAMIRDCEKALSKIGVL